MLKTLPFGLICTQSLFGNEGKDGINSVFGDQREIEEWPVRKMASGKCRNYLTVQREKKVASLYA